MAANPPTDPMAAAVYTDRNDVSEVFADGVSKTLFDGHNLRIEFYVVRFDEPKPPAPPTGKKLPTARIILSLRGAAELLNSVQQMQPALLQPSTGIKQVTPVPGSQKPQ